MGGRADAGDFVLYDASADKAYWLLIRTYCEEHPEIRLDRGPAHVSLHIPTAHLLDAGVIQRLVRYKNEVLLHPDKVIPFHD